MGNKLSDYFSIEFLKFLFASTIAAAVNFTARIIINQFTSYISAIILAYLFGMLSAFFLNKLLVFKKSSSSAHKQFAIFALVNVAAIIQTIIISVLLREYFFQMIGFSFYPEEVAHFIGLAVPAFTSYLGHKYFSFK